MITPLPDRVLLNSSVVSAAAYDPIFVTLELDFCDGARYVYSGVGPQIYRGLLGAVSKGCYFNQHIRGQFPHVKMAVEN